MWIDALCINQADDQEKSIQVARMGNIFKTSDMTLSWLGPEENNSNNAISLLRDAALGDLEIARESKQADWVFSLLRRPYFRRMWILQELGLAKNILLQCGFKKVPEKLFWMAVISLYSQLKPSSFCAARSQALDQIIVVCGMRFPRYDLFYSTLRPNMRNFHCHDPRDKIYAVLNLLESKERQLHVCPDYSMATERVYVDVARRKIERHHTLELFESCELASRTASVPSWVPDWSTPLMFHKEIHVGWSACGFISSQSSFDRSGLRCTIAGIVIGEVLTAKEASLDGSLQDLTQVSLFLKAIEPAEESLSRKYCQTEESLMEAYCRTLAADCFEGARQPEIIAVPNFARSLKYLNSLWTKDSNNSASITDVSQFYDIYLNEIYTRLLGRCFFETTSGHIGLAPTGTKSGDIVCVLLGSNLPVVLRPAFDIDQDYTWQVVGVSYVHGMMAGEAIYRSKHTAQYKPVLRYDETRDGFKCAFHDLDRDVFKTDAAEILHEAGIKTERYQQDPHELIVLPETLRAAGIPLEEFVLV